MAASCSLRMKNRMLSAITKKTSTSTSVRRPVVSLAFNGQEPVQQGNKENNQQIGIQVVNGCFGLRIVLKTQIVDHEQERKQTQKKEGVAGNIQQFLPQLNY